mmetsp:Transcript_21463/g.59516  ORF Transcript_21463/g.59516 Transcript_21463/m.59516 type:complete len:175 (+) Transcript_21463:1581-2105(+)
MKANSVFNHPLSFLLCCLVYSGLSVPVRSRHEKLQKARHLMRVMLDAPGTKQEEALGEEERRQGKSNHKGENLGLSVCTGSHRIPRDSICYERWVIVHPINPSKQANIVQHHPETGEKVASDRSILRVVAYGDWHHIENAVRNQKTSNYDPRNDFIKKCTPVRVVTGALNIKSW